MTALKEVTLSSSAGEIKRVVVKDLGDIVLVCRREEYDKSLVERREPAVVGFKKQDVVCR